jgi:hypothetical protein
MKKSIRHLSLSAALGAAGILGTNLLLADEKPAVKPAPADPVKPAVPAGRADATRTGAPGGNPMTDSKPDLDVAPVKVGEVTVKTDFAVKPKALSAAVKKGLEFLVKAQQDDGGWNQGGGWRVGTGGGGRVEGAKVEDPSDVGNTCFALLALLRAGNTVTEGEYKENVKKGLAFVIARVEKADKDSLYVTDVKGTQLQSKIGTYVDTFLVNLVLAEFRGKAGEQEKKLVAALEKTMTKIVRHQTTDGGFAGNAGWAPTLSMGIANKSIARAKERGATVDETVLKRALAQSTAAADNTAPAVVAGPAMAARPATPAVPAAGTPAGPAVATAPAVPATPATGPATTPAAPAIASAPSAPSSSGLASGTGGGVGMGGGGYMSGRAGMAGDAGVPLYRQSQGAGNTQDILNSLRLDAETAKKVVADAKASKEDKAKAEQKLGELKDAEKANDRVQADLAKSVKNESFVAGFGNNGGEEFLSFMNISEALLLKGGQDWTDWDAKMVAGLEKAQDKDGSWQGHHCITGKTFCTAGALLVLMADRTPFPVDVLKCAKEKRDNEKKPEGEKKPEAPKPEK